MLIQNIVIINMKQKNRLSIIRPINANPICSYQYLLSFDNGGVVLSLTVEEWEGKGSVFLGSSIFLFNKSEHIKGSGCSLTHAHRRIYFGNVIVPEQQNILSGSVFKCETWIKKLSEI